MRGGAPEAHEVLIERAPEQSLPLVKARLR